VMADQIDQMLNLVYVLLAMAVVIALFGIANTLALSVLERTRELGLLRAVGMDRGQVRSAVRWESVLIALLGTSLGTLIGVGFSWVLVEALADQGFVLALPAGRLVGIVALFSVAAVAVAALPAGGRPPPRARSRLAGSSGAGAGEAAMRASPRPPTRAGGRPDRRRLGTTRRRHRAPGESRFADTPPRGERDRIGAGARTGPRRGEPRISTPVPSSVAAERASTPAGTSVEPVPRGPAHSSPRCGRRRCGDSRPAGRGEQPSSPRASRRAGGPGGGEHEHQGGSRSSGRLGNVETAGAGPACGGRGQVEGNERRVLRPPRPARRPGRRLVHARVGDPAATGPSGQDGDRSGRRADPPARDPVLGGRSRRAAGQAGCGGDRHRPRYRELGGPALLGQVEQDGHPGRPRGRRTTAGNRCVAVPLEQLGPWQIGHLRGARTAARLQTIGERLAGTPKSLARRPSTKAPRLDQALPRPEHTRRRALRRAGAPSVVAAFGSARPPAPGSAGRGRTLRPVARGCRGRSCHSVAQPIVNRNGCHRGTAP